MQEDAPSPAPAAAPNATTVTTPNAAPTVTSTTTPGNPVAPRPSMRFQAALIQPHLHAEQQLDNAMWFNVDPADLVPFAAVVMHYIRAASACGRRRGGVKVGPGCQDVLLLYEVGR